MAAKSFQFNLTKPWPLVLGVDVGTHSIKYVFLRRRGKLLQVEGFGRSSLTGGETDIADQISEFIDDNLVRGSRYRKGKLVLGLQGQNVVLKKESFPPLSKKELQQTIFFSVQNDLGVEDGDSIVFDYSVIGMNPDKEGHTEYLVVGMDGDVVADQVAPFHAEEIVPSKAVLSFTAVANLIEDVSEEETAILDIGNRYSTLILVKEGRVTFRREISVGGSDFTRAITGTIFHEGQAIQFSADEAAEFKHRHGYPLGFSEGMMYKGAPLSEVGTLMRPVVERLIGEIQRSIGFYQEKSGGEEIRSLFLIGGGAQLKHLPEVLSEKLDIPVEKLTLPENLTIQGDGDQEELFEAKFPELATALSLAMETSEKCDLLPDTYKRIHKSGRLRKGLGYAAAAVVGGILLFSLQLQERLDSLRQQVVVAEKRALLSKNTGPRFATLMTQKNNIENEISTILQRMGHDDDIVQVFRLVSHTAPKNVSLSHLEYGIESEAPESQQDEEDAGVKWVLRIRGVSPRPANDVGIYLAKFIVDLEKSGYFETVELVRDILTPDEEDYWFEILATLDKGGTNAG